MFSSSSGDISLLSVFGGCGGLQPLLLLLEVELDGGAFGFWGGTGADRYSLSLLDIAVEAASEICCLSQNAIGNCM